MFGTIIGKIKNRLVGNGADRPWPKWVVPAIFALIVLILSGSIFYFTSATVRTYSIWSNDDTPRVVNQYDLEPVELGMKFQTKVAGQVTGVKFYKGSKNTGTHTGTLWDKRGKKLAVVTFTNETKSGWQTATFATPVKIAANTTYVVSYFAPKGHFSIDSHYFARSSRTNGPLTALRSGADGTNGVYAYSLASSFPSDDSDKDNYWVDVLFQTGRGETLPATAAHPSIKAFDSTTPITDQAWFKKAYDDGFRLYVANVTQWNSCAQLPEAQTALKAALASGLQVAAYTHDPGCWADGIKATGLYKDQLQFFALNADSSGPAVTRAMVNSVKATGVRPMIYANASSWSGTQGKTAADFTDLPLWDTSLMPITYRSWQPDYVSPSPVVYSGWNTAANMRVGVQQTLNYMLDGVNINLSSFDSTFLSTSPTKPVPPVVTPPPATPTPPESNPTTPTTPSVGRAYPLHTKINTTTYWVGEQFQATSDGSQVCSAYDSQWQYSFFHLKLGTNTTPGCKGAPTGGCDAQLKTAGGKCDDTNSIASLRTPANGYFPAGLPQIYENPFYLDLPYDDYNQSDSTDTTGYATRCRDIPWANDAGYAGRCTDKTFSYMKNRFVKIMANGKTCYGQIEDAGPADDGNGNGNYADAPYVFGSNDARPYNKSYNSAGMDISPALNACLGGKFNTDLTTSWQFVDDVDVPAGPWKTIITTTKPN